MKLKSVKLLIITLFFVFNANAAMLSPVSYDMFNGSSGNFSYWDDSYNGSGNNQADSAYLSGGLGDLTDGVIATQSWNVAELETTSGPYVGWSNLDPTINFHFNSRINFNTITIYADDFDGHVGVSQPTSVTVNGTNFIVADHAGADPFAISLTNLGLTSTDLDITIYRGNSWVFVSEVTFDGVTAVPVPAGVWLFISGLLSLFGYARFKQ